MASEQQNVPAPPAQRICSFTDASEHENCWPFLRSEGHVALVYKANNASWIERIGIEDLLILRAARAAGCLFTGSCDNVDRRSVIAGTGTRRTGGTGRTGGARRSGLTLGGRLALSAGGQDKGG